MRIHSESATHIDSILADGCLKPGGGRFRIRPVCASTQKMRREKWARGFRTGSRTDIKIELDTVKLLASCAKGENIAALMHDSSIQFLCAIPIECFKRVEEYKKNYNLTLYTNPHIGDNQSKGDWKPCAIRGISLPVGTRLCWSNFCYAPQNTQGMDDWKRLFSTHGAGQDDAMRMFSHMFHNANLGVQRPT